VPHASGALLSSYIRICVRGMVIKGLRADFSVYLLMIIY